MIKNIVFDFGQVLVHYEPAYIVSQHVTDPSDASLLAEVIFDRLYWDRLDEGTITDEETLAACRTRLPERLWESASRIYYNWIYHIPEMEGMGELIDVLKHEYGVHVYVLSNISKYFASHAEEISILRKAEGCIFSSLCGYIKPSPEIFRHLCDSFSLSPNETVFIDDNEKNVKGARAFGLAAYQFDGDVSRLRDYLFSLLMK